MAVPDVLRAFVECAGVPLRDSSLLGSREARDETALLLPRALTVSGAHRLIGTGARFGRVPLRHTGSRGWPCGMDGGAGEVHLLLGSLRFASVALRSATLLGC